MKIFLFILFMTNALAMCGLQNNLPESKWKEVVLEEANMKVRVPCVLKKSVKTLQETPRPI